MPVYLCRWPNGEFSIVAARNKSDAIELLDEWGNAEQGELSRLEASMFDFRLTDDGAIELSDIGEQAYDIIMERCYPILQEAFGTAEMDHPESSAYTEVGQRTIREAVERERKRLWDNQPPGKEADTELGRQIQKRMGASSVVANRAVRAVSERVLHSKEGEGKKPS